MSSICEQSAFPYYPWLAVGQTISEKDKCPQCRGNKIVQDKKILEVNVEKGMQHNQKIVFQGEADEAVRLPRRCQRPPARHSTLTPL